MNKELWDAARPLCPKHEAPMESDWGHALWACPVDGCEERVSWQHLAHKRERERLPADADAA